MKNIIKNNFYIKVLIISIIGLLISFGVATFSKYIAEDFHGYYLNAKHFYFTSNRLAKNNPVYQVNNWSGVGQFDISFSLLSQKNDLVYSEFDIPYTVRAVCPTGVTCTLDNTSGTIYNSNLSHSVGVTLNVNPSRQYAENEHLTIYIEATSTSPYQETIGATFEYVVGKQGVTYQIDDEANRVYLLFKVTNAINYCTVKTAFGSYQVNDTIDNSVYRTLNSTDQSKCVSKVIDLSFDPNVLRIDTTESIIDESVYQSTSINSTDFINYLSFNIAPLSTTAIKFYKINTANNYTYPITNNTSIINVNIHD